MRNPNSHNLLKSNKNNSSTKVSSSSSTENLNKRKYGSTFGEANGSNLNQSNISSITSSSYVPSNKRSRTDYTKLVALTNGFYPSEYPFNKDGYRYILAEPDPHAPFRKQFDEGPDWAGKPIPGFLYRTHMPPKVTLSLNDRAHQLKLNENRFTVTGEKGYSMIRATHGVNFGTWYFECKIVEMPDKSAIRLGWSQHYGNLQAPLGYDKFGYSWRSKNGTLFHQSKGQHFMDVGYTTGDVIGCYIHLPCRVIPSTTHGLGSPIGETPAKSFSLVPQTCKTNPLVKFKGYLYFEQKDEVDVHLKQLQPLPGSFITFFKNGKLQAGHSLFEPRYAFQDIYCGSYFPSISIYYGAIVSFNPGPVMEYSPELECQKLFLPQPKPVSDLIYLSAVQQSMSDLLHFASNKGKFKL